MDIQHYLNTNDTDILPPELLINMDKGVKMLVSHIGRNSKIFVQVDSDCDGLTSSAVLLNYLNAHFPHFVQNNIVYRMHEGKQHGLILDTIPSDVGLVIAPDSSSNDYEIHEQLSQRGIDVLVLDHHEAEKLSPHACVINNQLCDYPTKSLSGVGIVFKFCQYLDTFLKSNSSSLYLDLVALGLIADMMDMTDFETRHLITLGLKNIHNPFFQYMVQKQAFSLGDTLTPIGVAFYIAPYINAICRSGTNAEKLLVFEAMLEFKAYEQIPSTKRGCMGQIETRVEQACRTCVNVKNRQTRSRDSSVDIIESIIEDKHLLENKILAIKLDKKHTIDKNLTGLIANQLMSKYQRPVLLLNEVKNEDGITWEGSGRGYDKSEMKDFRAFLENSGLAESVGHANAFGCFVSDDNFNELIKYANEQLEMFDFSPKYNVDFVYDNISLNDTDIASIASYKNLWGQGIEEPKVVIRNLSVTKENLTLMKGSTLKITLPNSEVTLIKFGSSNEEYEELYSDLGCVIIDVVGTCDINSWNMKPQIKILDFEIKDKKQYYF